MAHDERKRGTPLIFNPADIGGSLKEVAVDLIQTENQDVVSRWFHSAKDADLFLWFDERGNIIKQQITFCGQVVEWNVLEGVRTGYVVEREPEGQGYGVDGSDLIEYDSKIQTTSLNQALELITNITELSKGDRLAAMDNLKSSPDIRNMDPDLFLSRYGRADVTIKVGGLWKHLWQRLLTWILHKK